MTNLVRAMVVLAALAATGRADELPAAARHYVAGKELYDAHLYRRALAEFEAGYVASELPGFLLDMAQCHRQLGERDDALRDYRSYLARDATSATAHEVRALVAELEAEEPPAPSPPTITLVAPAAPPPPRAKRPFTWAGVALSGTLVVAGIGLEIATRQTFDDLRASCGATVAGCSTAERSTFDRDYAAATGVLIAAAVASVATVAAAALEERARRKAVR